MRVRSKQTCRVSRNVALACLVGIIKSLHLERSGLAQVSALARSNAEACKRGIRIESTNPDVGTVEHFQPHKIYSTPAEAAQDSYDAVLISAKSLPDIRPTSETLKPFIPPASSQAKVPAIVLVCGVAGCPVQTCCLSYVVFWLPATKWHWH